ncbi:MAG: HAMP domain-containing histidine kinase [Deltaproteobacteria bacterium]|nr:HAMP domain-containing histidine kinase [Deltaproteobacteria bacterium]
MQHIVAPSWSSMPIRPKFTSIILALAGDSSIEDGTKARWLLRLRWAAVAAMIAGLAGFRHYGLIAGEDIASYVAAVTLLIAANVFLSLGGLYQRLPLLLQMLLDLAVLGFTLGMTQGCANPMSALIYMHAVLGPLLLRGRQGLIYLMAIGLAVSYYCLNSQPVFHGLHGRPLPHAVSLVAQLLVVIVIWSLTLSLSTRLRTLRSSLELARAQCQRADHLRALGAMAASFTHEFATPLNTAKMRLERQKRRAGSTADASPHSSGSGDVDAALAAIEQCEAVMRSMFGAELQAGHVRFEELKVADFVLKVCDSWSQQHPDVVVRTHVDTAAAAVTCSLPSLALARSLMDLLDNAREASGDQNVAIEMTVTSRDGMVTIAVSDRGAGVPHLLRERLGEAFVSSRPDGTGLGLYTARSLAEALGGSLDVADRARGGTVVSLHLQLDRGSMA